ncbi:VOC family protein [Aquimarina sp. I32.4]|uniref:VOC family protein n=1 Tax=Aquimarina sp. I32.4 TaxID=2053903 RepID=UPI000CDF0F34|nr:VOC family protein [Aquimarina sp. I32.4]
MLKCSHIVYKVDNIQQVVEDYKALGFSPVWGSTPEKAHNAFLWFDEGPYIEFFQLPKKFEFLKYPLHLFYGRSAGQRWQQWAKTTEGWCDLALEPQEYIENTDKNVPEYPLDIKTIKNEMNKSGISASRIIRNKRINPGGEKVKYKVFCPNPEGFPFVFSGYETPQKPEGIKHANGATKIAWVKLDMDSAYIDQFQEFIKEDKYIKAIPSSQTRVFDVGLSGLKLDLNPDYLHGATFTAS